MAYKAKTEAEKRRARRKAKRDLLAALELAELGSYTAAFRQYRAVTALVRYIADPRVRYSIERIFQGFA